MEQSAQSTPALQPEVRVYEYMVPGVLLGPPKVIYPAPRRPVPPHVLRLYRWIQQHYGLR
ncbi:MAG TPA: hypothetical protein VD969_05635 [Symbiobacteriaceae bacterium]|nr:hypothetical protein [Symbiobacteriaceae bacterium]